MANENVSVYEKEWMRSVKEGGMLSRWMERWSGGGQSRTDGKERVQLCWRDFTDNCKGVCVRERQRTGRVQPLDKR